MTRKRSTAESERHADDKSQSLDDGNRLPDDNNQSHDSGNQLPDDNNQSADAGNELPDDNNRTADDDNWDADDLKSLPDAVGTPLRAVGTSIHRRRGSRGSVLECSSPLELSAGRGSLESAGGLSVEVDLGETGLFWRTTRIRRRRAGGADDATDDIRAGG